jgi:hypothetical protein
MARFAFLLFFGLAVVNQADAARRGCQAFGKQYRDGESYTISIGEYGRLETYVCVDGNWYSRPR